MRRSRVRLGWCALAGAMALAWPAALVVPAVAAPVSLTVSPATVQAGQETTLLFTFTAPTPPPAQFLVVTLPVPAGWTAIPPSPGDLSCQGSGCYLAASSTQTSVTMNLDDVTTFTLAVQATPPESAGPATFTAVGNFRGLPTPLQATAPPVTVTCPADGLGSMTVSPLTVRTATATTLTFTYTAGSCGLGPDGMVGVTVPGGWTPAGTVMVPAANLAPGTPVSFSYGPAQASSAGQATFVAWQSGAGGPQQDLVSSPVVTVTPAGVIVTPPPPPPPPPPPGGPGTMTVTPVQVTAARPSTLRFTYTAGAAGLSPSGEVTVVVPAGWTAPSPAPGQAGYTSASGGRLTVTDRQITVTGVTLRPGRQLVITYAAGNAPRVSGLDTFLTRDRPAGTATLAALTRSPAVAVAPVSQRGRAGMNWLPIVLAVIGLVAGAAGLAAFRPLRRGPLPHGPLPHGPHGTGAGDVRAVPHAGPPPSVTIRDTGGRPALTVRIEPRAGTPVTTIKERQP
jgi:hypothetical protein